MSTPPRRSFLLLAAVFAALAPAPAAGWNCAGHILTALVALNRTAAAPDAAMRASFVDPLLGHQVRAFPGTLSTAAETACWPDDLKAYERGYSGWHYHDTCYLPPGGGGTCPPTDAGSLNTAIATAVAQLSSLPPTANGTNVPAMAFWLTFLLHLVGDAHQPMHLCTMFSSHFPHGDLGGNRFRLITSEGPGIHSRGVDTHRETAKRTLGLRRRRCPLRHREGLSRRVSRETRCHPRERTAPLRGFSAAFCGCSVNGDARVSHV